MIRFKPGTVYDVAHLRPFDLEKALAGHPLATRNGCAVRLLRFLDANNFAYDYWSEPHGQWYTNFQESAENIAFWCCLAPLAIKDGCPLHVGDEIICGDVQRKITWLDWLALQDFQLDWRWPESKA